MNITLDSKYEPLVHEKLRRGEYGSAEELVNAALQLLADRDEDRRTLLAVNQGEPLPIDDRFEVRLDMLLEEAEESGEGVELSPQDWSDIRRDGLALIQSRKSA